MTRVKPGQRKRAKAEKVRTGCKTCKIRHVKCDEARPACQRCALSGRSCDGYDQTPDSSESDIVRKMSVLSPLHAGLDSIRYDEHDGSRAFEFFQLKTLEQFQRAFKDRFWGEIVLQLAHTEPSIIHAVSALSFLHESFVTSQARDGPARTRRALRWYNEAIRDLVQPGSRNLPLEIQAVSCLIFFNIEALLGHPSQAVRLFKHGVRLLNELRTDQYSASSSVKDMISLLHAAFVRLDLQVNFLLDEPTQISEFHGDDHKHNIELVFETPFASLSDAKIAMERLTLSCMQASLSYGNTRAAYRLQLAIWTQGFDDLVASMTSPSPSDLRGIAQLRVFQRSMDIVQLNIVQTADGTCCVEQYAESTQVFEEIVNLATVVLCDDEGHQPENTYSPDIGLVPLLWIVLRHCQDPLTRRKALYLLRTSNRVEGIWPSALTARVGERYLALVEAGYPVADTKNMAEECGIPVVQSLPVKVEPHEDEKSAVIRYGDAWDSFHETVTWL